MKQKIKVTTDLPTATINNFAFTCKRKREYINKACDEGQLNHAFAFEGKRESGIKLVILDDLSKEFLKKCKTIDRK